MVKVNDEMIDFVLPDSNGNNVSISDFSDKTVIVYFYSKDNTSGCTCQALEYKKLYKEFTELNTVVIGISKDSIESHKKFISKNELPFILLSDVNKDVINKYDVFKEKNMYGKKVMGVLRSSFIIRDGKYIKVTYNTKSNLDAINNLDFLKNN
ncbi:MAG: peroxiredoxin [Acholeplasmatales bacterium]|nr:peroxiredoxin [Acholeplasmatales bacterium]